MAKPNRYWMRLTAEFDGGATYHVQREVTRLEIDGRVASTEDELMHDEFDVLQHMLRIGLARKERG